MRNLNDTVVAFIATMLMQDSAFYPWMKYAEMYKRVSENLALVNAIEEKDKIKAIKAIRDIFASYKGMNEEGVKLFFPEDCIQYGRHTAYVMKNHGPWDIKEGIVIPRLGLKEAKDIVNILFHPVNQPNLFR